LIFSCSDEFDSHVVSGGNRRARRHTEDLAISFVVLPSLMKEATSSPGGQVQLSYVLEKGRYDLVEIGGHDIEVGLYPWESR
jgi:hypothetical protein